MLDFDTMLMHVGEFGLYQKILFVFQAPFCIFVTFVSFGQLFILLYPRNYWCEQHFACLDSRSNIPAAQRRNISYAWRNEGLFRSDPCMPNNITDDILKTLSDLDERECSQNRSAPCSIYLGAQGWQANISEESRSSSGRPRQDSSSDRRRPGSTGTNPNRDRYSGSGSRLKPPYQLGDESIPDYEDGGSRATRQWYGGGSQSSRGSSDNYYGDGDSNGRGNYYDPGSSDDGRNNNGNSGSRGSFSRFPNSGETTTKRPWSSSGSGSSGNNRRPGTDRPDGGRGSSKSRGKGRNRNTPINSPYAGWPKPECPRSESRTEQFIFIGANTSIFSHTMNNMRFRSKDGYNKMMKSICATRWNRSELPYETIVTQGEWWCWAEAYTTFAQAIFFVGAIVGGFLIGYVADTFGRVPALVIANVLGAIGGSLSASTTDVWLFSFYRFIAGMAFDNCFTMMYILVLEFCGPTYRTLVANLSIAIFYTVGTILLPIFAVTIANWQIFQLVTSLPMLLALLAIFFVPESARWLLSKGRAAQATKILRNFAKVNGRKVDDQIFVEFEQEATQLSKEWEGVEEPSLTAAFKTPRLRRTFIFLIIFWSMIALVYDGHNRNIMNLANEDLDVFWLFAIASMTEFPADILLIFTLDRFGRRWLAFGSMALSALFSFIAGIITPDVRTGFLITAIISRFWVNVTFNIGLQYAAELLPTVIRAQGVNTIHIMGYVASLISPFVAAIGRSNPTLSLFLLGAFSLTAGVVALFLAETLGEELPNTLEEAEAFGKNQSFWNCPICAKEVEEEAPISPPPAALEDRPVVLRNALRGSIRGATYRSSMISNASSGSSRNSKILGAKGGVTLRPEPTEMTRLRRITH